MPEHKKTKGWCRWSSADDPIVLDDSVPLAVTAARLGRTVSAVRSRRRQLRRERGDALRKPGPPRKVCSFCGRRAHGHGLCRTHLAQHQAQIRRAEQ
jgi:hypothetical protein